MRRATGPACWRRYRKAHRHLRGGTPPPAGDSRGRGDGIGASVGVSPPTASRRTQHSTPSSYAGNGFHAPRRRSDSRRPCHGHTSVPHSTGAVARSAPRCGHARGATSRPPSAPRQATICTPPTVAPQALAAICELAAKAYQLPLGRRCARRERRPDHRRVGLGDRWAPAPTSPIGGSVWNGQALAALTRRSGQHAHRLFPPARAASRRSSAERP